MIPVAAPALHNCTFKASSITPPQTIEEGVSNIEHVLEKDLLCMHDVEVLNQTYLALDRLEQQVGKIPERNSSTALKMIAKKVDAITKGSFSSRGLISLYYLQKFSEKKLQIAGRFENFRTSMSFNEDEVAAELCNCGTEEQFDSDVNALIGANRNETVNQLLYQKKEKFRLMAEKERKIEAVKENWRRNGSSCVCPLTLGLITDPVLDEHGHCFERRALAMKFKTHPVCPLNDKPLTEEQLIPNDDLKKQIESFKAQGFSMTRHKRMDVPEPAVTKQLYEMTKHFIAEAQILELQQKFGEAEQFYNEMLTYSSNSKDYAHIPALFEKKGEKVRAAAAYVVLAELQRAEGKLEEEIVTLKKSLTLASNCIIKERLATILFQRGQNAIAAQLYLELAKQALYNRKKIQAERCCGEVSKIISRNAEVWRLMAVIKSDQSVEILLRGAREISMPIKERISLCKMAELKDPDHLPSQMLFFELKGIIAKNKMSQLKSKISEKQVPATSIALADMAMEVFCHKESSSVQKISPFNHIAQQPLPVSPTVLAAPAVQATDVSKVPDWVFGAAKWNKYFGHVGDEPPLPQEIVNRLHKLQQKNVLVLIPETVKGVPLNLETLGKLVQKPLNGGHSTQYKYFSLGEYIDKPTPKSHWALLTRSVIKGSRGKCYADEHTILARYGRKTKIAYEVPAVLDATICNFIEYVQSGTWLYGDTPLTYTFCQEEHKSVGWLSAKQLFVGGGSDAGLIVKTSSGKSENTGVGGLKKFF